MSASQNLRSLLRQSSPVLALLAGALVVLAALWARFGSFTGFMLRLDPVAALGTCSAGRSVKLACDFANHYYPQGRRLASSPTAVFGYFYSGFFAVGMQGLAHLPYETARTVWECIVVGSEGFLLLAPLLLGSPRPITCFAYGLVLTSSLPVLHDFAYGQVSSLLTALTLASFVAYGRDRRYLSAALLGVAAAIKFYPGLFAIHYLLRRDLRSFAAFSATTLLLVAGVPWLALGASGAITLHTSIFENIGLVASFMSATPYSSFVANAMTYAGAGAIDPESSLYRAARVFGAGIALFHLYLAHRAVRKGTSTAVFAPMMLGFLTIPFVVRPSWVHYFVFLPMLELYVLELPSRDTASPLVTLLSRGGALVSALLIGAPLFLLVPNPDDYYHGALPFWATAVLLPALYLASMRPRAHAPEPAHAPG